MTASLVNRSTDERGDKPIARNLPALPVAAATHILQGVLVALNLSGYLVEASADPTLRVLGRSEEEVDNSAGTAGALSCKVRRGVFGWANSSSTAAIALSHVGRFVYAADNQTVSLTNPLGLYPVAGRVYDIEDSMVFVETGAHPDQAQGTTDLYIVTAADLSAAQGLFVALNSSGLVVLAATAGQAALGGLVNAPVSGAVAIVRRRGLLRMVFSDATVEGAPVAVTVTTGRAKTAVAGTVSGSSVVGSNIMGTCLEESTGAADTALVDLHPMGVAPTTLA